MLESIEKAVQVARLADSKKAEDIVVLDMREVCSFTDHFVICTGQSSLQLQAISGEVHSGLKKVGEPNGLQEGTGNSPWVIMDYGDVVVHIMSPEARNHYRLESLWGDASEINWPAALAAMPAG